MSLLRSARTNKASGSHKKSKAFLTSTTAIVAALMFLPSNVGAQDATPTNSWDYDVVVGGNVDKDTSAAGITDITVIGGNGFVEGNADIYDGHEVNIAGDAGTTFAYRDNRDNIESTLNGTLNSNIQVVIIDKDGLFFGDNFSADVQSLVATTGDISVDNLMDSNADLLISNVGQGGSIVQTGTVTVGEAGLAAFVSPFVTNNGVINATLGTVSFAAGETVTLDLYGDGLVEVAVEGELAYALLENRGAILAQGGHVQITAIAAKDTLSNIVNNSGIIDVSSVSVEEGGRIVLSGDDAPDAAIGGGDIILSGGDAGTVRNAGLLRTSESGSVNIDAERFVHEGNNFFIIPTIKPDFQEQELEVFDTVEIIEIRPTTLASIETAGGDVNIETTGDVILGANGVGYPNVVARSIEGEPTKFGGGASINADGGNINIDNDGVFYSAFENTLRTSGEGTVSVRQHAGVDLPIYEEEFDVDNELRFASAKSEFSFRGISIYPASSIQNAIDAISNTGTGRNTVTVGAGSFGAVEIDHANLTLRGANAGLAGNDAARGAETIINPNSPGILITADNAVVNGVAVVGGADEGVLVDSADNVVVRNSVISGSGTHGVSVVNSADVRVRNNDISDIAGVGVKAFISNDVVIANNEISDVATGVQVDYSRRARIVGNDISDVTKEDNAQADGIRVNGGQDVRINRNVISDVNDDGIFISDASGTANVSGNTITNVGLDIAQSGNGIELIFARGDAVVHNNTVSNVRGDGILFKESRNDAGSYDVTNNTVTNTGANGIKADENARYLFGNNVSVAAEDGITVSQSQGVFLDENVVTDVEENGIYVTNSNNAILGENTITDAEQNGIYLRFSHSSRIAANNVSDAGTGIRVAYSDHANIDENRVSDITKNADSQSDGIFVEGGSNITVSVNAITNTNDEGIFLTNTSGTTNVFGNIINSVGQGVAGSGNGIELIYTQGDANIYQNSITSTSATGILIKRSTFSAGPFVVDGNVITSVGASGVDIDKNAVSVSNNVVDTAGENGIIVRSSSGVQIMNNATGNIQEAGIRIRFSNDSLLERNTISHAGTGIYSDSSNNIVIGANNIANIDQRNDYLADGIHVDGGKNVGVFSNVISNTNDEGVFVAYAQDELKVIGNRVSNAGVDINSFGNGIELLYTRGNSEVAFNTIYTVRDSGILIKRTQPSAGLFVVRNNNVSNSGVHGFYANGANIDSVVFLGNTLTDNALAQTRFESGAIDMSDITNPNVFINTTGGPAVGLQFDKTTSSDLTVVGETLGATEFTGYTDVDSFYVRFEDGAILSAPSTPIVIDANAVSFDGVIADAFPGSILPAAQLQFIEDRLFDADDAAVNGRGQIFEPVAPTPAGITNVEDFLQTPEDSQSTSNNASLRINGLPPVSLANVGDLNAVEPAAGDETGELNDIEPAAGDLAQVTCASDAANAVGTASVSYVFGGSFEDSLAGAAACSINAI